MKQTLYAAALALLLLQDLPADAAAPGCDPVSGLEPLLAGRAAVFVGEMHGTVESPAFFAALACHAVGSGRSLTVGLELVASEKGRVEAYLESDGTPAARSALLSGPDWTAAYQDGRASLAMADLLESLRLLRSSGHEVEVVLFDRREGGSSQARDRLMAETLTGAIRSSASDHFLVLTGNVHSRQSRGTPWNDAYEPMAFLISQAGPGRPMISLNVAHSGGSAWICTGGAAEDCGERPLKGRAEGQAMSVTFSDEVQPGGHHGVYFVGPITASPPAVTQAAAAPVASAAQAPSTDVWVIPLSRSEGVYELGTPANVTDRDGYDNQPKFLPGGGLVYSSQRDGQTDIYLHDLAGGATRQVTATAESEYSPTPMPGGGAISVVRDYGDGAQQLWAFPLGDGEPRLLLTHELGPIGYHAWVDGDELVLFVLGDPMTLQLAEVGATTGRRLADNPGRALAAMPDGSGMSFVHKVSEEEWWLSAVDPASGEIRRLVRTPAEREDYAWAPDGSVWMGDGARLHAWRPGEEGWTQVADLSSAGIGGISRLAFDPQGGALAVVAER